MQQEHLNEIGKAFINDKKLLSEIDVDLLAYEKLDLIAQAQHGRQLLIINKINNISNLILKHIYYFSEITF